MKNKITKSQKDNIERKIEIVQEMIEKYLNTKIATLEEEIGVNLNLSINDERDYCRYNSFSAELHLTFEDPREETRQYIERKKK